MSTRAPRPFVPAKTYKKRGPNTWAAVREGYLAGATASDLAERFDITVHALTYRARREGWRKLDLPDLLRPAGSGAGEGGAPEPPPVDLDAPEPSDHEGRPLTGEPELIAVQALIQAEAAVRLGRPNEAERYVQLAERLGRLAGWGC